ncbi:MAG: thiamine pyrophosphate-binding protein [Spirochaetaceae bacterium]|nr:thiamine pyrophosphate-binding protein [Spirochaetaceae bacterium]
MKQRLADYIADFLVDNGITDCFSVVGGGAMHLNDALGHEEGLHCTYNHHEQACAIAAESYARLNNKIAALCVTTGPGGTNAITGVLGGWLDSIPMFVLSGQVRYDTTARYCEQFTDGYKLRAVGDQEFDITKSVSAMCKYAVMLEDPNKIRFVLEKALHLAKTGRPGPVWIDVPVNFQGAVIETEGLESYIGSSEQNADDAVLPPKIDKSTINKIIDKIKASKRPVLYAGNGIRLSGGYDDFRSAVEKLGIPVCTYWDSIDAIETEHPLYVGRAGNMGERPGNFAVQNADLILAVGNRLPIRVTGYNWKAWAREAEVIMVDIDPAELKKPAIHVEMPVHADAKDFFEQLNEALKNQNKPLFTNGEWIKVCQNWKKKYPVLLEHHKTENDGFANAYAAFDIISRALPENTLTVTSNGTCCVAGHQTWFIKKGCRFFNNNAVASMGYGLPAAIGACIANNRKTTICLEGDGSIMMNLQELQTIVTNRLPIKIILINNQGYHSIRQTQSNLFANHCKVGIGVESGDLSFPEFKKIAAAFGIPYFEAHSNAEVKTAFENVMQEQSFAMCEIFVSTTQFFEPKNSARRLEDGTLVSAPLEDLAPFLSREELKENMFIKMEN